MALIDLLSHLIPTGGRKSRSLISSGERANATVAGIRVTERGESPPRWEYALDVHAATGTFRAGCRQTLGAGARRAATIGGQVAVLHRNGQVIIDEATMMGGDAGVAASTGNTGWRQVEPPPVGISDERFAKHQAAVAGATATTVTVVEVKPTDWEERWSLVALVEGDSDRRITVTGKVPHYAAGSVVPGSKLPAGLTSTGAVVIDWFAAATTRAPLRNQLAPATPPTNERAATPADARPYQFESKSDAKEFQAWLKLRAVRSSGVPESTLVIAMKKFGIAADSWPSIDTKWSQRCNSNPDLAEQLRLAKG